MTGECLTTLVRMMEAHGDAGIIQTAPRAVGHETLHGRIQQFSARAYGPLFTAGMRFWQLGESHYWGHNAILRMAPFMAHCALAPLPGDGPLSGEVMSHDFVEAALMRRAGWKVWVADELDGSYEQVPPNLLAELQRDRRWCHGNLQNSRLMFEPRLHAVHRTAFLTGVLAYASSPLWLAFLLLSTLLFAQTAGSDPTYFPEPYQLFPVWPTANVGLMLTLFGLTAVLLLAPKVLALVAHIASGEARRFGGRARLVASALIEFVHSLLLAPVRMLFHTQFVIAALTGWRLDWKSPPRDDASTSWREAAARHGVHTVLAIVWIAAIVVVELGIPVVAVADPRRAAARDPALGPDEPGQDRPRAAPPRPDADAGRKPRAARSPGSAPRRRGRRLASRDAARCRRRSARPAARRRRAAALAAAARRQGRRGSARGSSARCAKARRRSPPDDGLRLVSSRHALAVMRREVVARRAHPDWDDAAAAASIADGARDDRAVAAPVASDVARDSRPLAIAAVDVASDVSPRRDDRVALTRRSRFG